MTSTPALSSSSQVLLVGFGLHGRAVATSLRDRNIGFMVVDDAPSGATLEAARELDLDLVVAPEQDRLDALARGATHLVPTPGLPASHPIFAVAAMRNLPVVSEFDLAGEWDDRPIVAITGTNGKTTVTTLVTQMLNSDGTVATMAGNMELPLVSAIDDRSAELFVVEASSFRLGHSVSFRPRVGTWLNFAPDHLDVHGTLEAYELAKAKLWNNEAEEAIAIGNANDPVVLRHLPGRPTDLTFGAGSPDAHADGGALQVMGHDLGNVDELPRQLPHDLDNYLAASLTAMAAGASASAVARSLREFRGLPHRMELVSRAGGISWYNDSKATTPHAVVAGVSGHRSAVLIAGGRNKGVDLSGLAELAPNLRSVVAIGEAASEVGAAFDGVVAVESAASMEAAVCAASIAAREGDSVVLSPGCTSYDWYGDYAERGEDFVKEVLKLTGTEREAR